MELKELLNLLWAPAVAFGAWVVKELNSKTSKKEVRELIQDKYFIYTVYVQELKEDIKRLENKLDRLIDKSDK